MAKIFAMAATIAIMIVMLVWFVPDGNDYALATNEKHDRLAAGNTPCKIVFLGGSNLAYGLDSSLVEKELGCHVVNMGMDGLLGARFMTEEIKPELKSGDIAVVSMEYDSYFRAADGQGVDLIMLVKARPRSAQFVARTSQVLKIAKSLSIAAHMKMLRLIRERVQGSGESESLQLLNTVERHSGFNKYGDLVSHLEVKWPYKKRQGLDLSNRTRDELTLPILDTFAEDMQARGVQVFLLHGPVMDVYYQQHRDSIEQVHADLKRSTKLQVLTPPSTYVFPESHFFDSVYHLTPPAEIYAPAS